jgi:DNA invertase Pin-like site-specific DNA recombinase
VKAADRYANTRLFFETVFGEPTVKRVAVYCRTSTNEQIKGLDSQIAAIEAYLQANGITDVIWFREQLSGKDLNRPAFAALQAAIDRQEVGTVVCWSLDRLSRNLVDGINTLVAWCKAGIRCISVTQQLDFSGPTGELVASVLFAVAAMQRSALQEATVRGLKAARARGTRLGAKPRLHALEVKELVDSVGWAEAAARLQASQSGLRKCLARAQKAG